jgi:hypothetical protein
VNEVEMILMAQRGELSELATTLKKLVQRKGRVVLSHIVFRGNFPRVEGVTPPKEVVLVDVKP